ncbi:PAS domain-containing protein [Methanoculleus chikugoensis]|uniref:PAS domain-containing protein n=1 Tax=Methanoculleus chikugoensis TaxID=118126 RepID=UPI001FB364D0|nr:PAS domain-containing protein [Methanoculleus chikugoensis]
MEEALRESEERYRRLFEDDLTGDFLTVADGRIIACNPAFVRMFGFDSVDDALDTNILDLYEDPPRDRGHAPRTPAEGREGRERGGEGPEAPGRGGTHPCRRERGRTLQRGRRTPGDPGLRLRRLRAQTGGGSPARERGAVPGGSRELARRGLPAQPPGRPLRLHESGYPGDPWLHPGGDGCDEP